MLLRNPPPVCGRIYTGFYLGVSVIVSLVLPLLSLLPLPILGKVVRERIEFSHRETWPILKGIFVGYTLGSFIWVLILRLSWRMTTLSMIMVGTVAVGLFWLGWFMSWIQQQYRGRKQAPV